MLNEVWAKIVMCLYKWVCTLVPVVHIYISKHVLSKHSTIQHYTSIYISLLTHTRIYIYIYIYGHQCPLLLLLHILLYPEIVWKSHTDSTYFMYIHTYNWWLIHTSEAQSMNKMHYISPSLCGMVCAHWVIRFALHVRYTMRYDAMYECISEPYVCDRKTKVKNIYLLNGWPNGMGPVFLDHRACISIIVLLEIIQIHAIDSEWSKKKRKKKKKNSHIKCVFVWKILPFTNNTNYFWRASIWYYTIQ